jgi:hypothetical protein
MCLLKVSNCFKWSVTRLQSEEEPEDNDYEEEDADLKSEVE